MSAIKQQNLRLGELEISTVTPTIQGSDLCVRGNSQSNSSIKENCNVNNDSFSPIKRVVKTILDKSQHKLNVILFDLVDND